MITFKELEFKRQYNAKVDEIISSFYIPLLTISKEYWRYTAYFNCDILKQYSTGIANIYKNNGQIKFVFSQKVDSQTLLKVQEGYRNKAKFLPELKEEDVLDDVNIANLSYLISIGLVETKLCFMDEGFMHIKSGFFVDEAGNEIYFTGSANETNNGLINNWDNFTVYFSYDDNNPSYKKLALDNIDFLKRVWNNDEPLYHVIDGNDILYDAIKIANKEKVFESERDFFYGKVVLDIGSIDGEKVLLVKDYSEKGLSEQTNLKSRLSFLNFTQISYNIYVKNLSVSNLMIYQSLTKAYKSDTTFFDYELYETKRFLNWKISLIANYEKRKNIGISLKNDSLDETTKNKVENFKNKINSNFFAANHQLDSYQALASYFQYAMHGCANYSVPGTGKTTMAYATYIYLKEVDKLISNLLVVCPKSAFKAWKDEYYSCFGRSGKILCVSDVSDFESEIAKNSFMYDIVCINYESVGKYKKLLMDSFITNKSMIVFDEVHKIKNPEGKRASDCLSLINVTQYKLLLSGTPMPNSFSDLYNQLRIIFNNERPFNYNLKSLKDADQDFMIANALQSDVYPYFIRITKKDLNIHPANSNDLISLRVNGSEAERKLLEEIAFDYHDNPLLLIIRSLQAESNPKLILNSIDNADFFDEDDKDNLDVYKMIDYHNNVKYSTLIKEIGITTKMKKTIDFAFDFLKDNHKKLVIWCLFVDSIKLISTLLEKNGINNVAISGLNKSIKERELLIEKFKNDPKTRVLITNPNTMAESVSLHTVCHDAIYYEYGFNLTYLLQSKDRIHRFGISETQETNYYFSVFDYAIGKKTLDLAILDRLNLKEERMKETIEDHKLSVEQVESVGKIIDNIYSDLGL